MPKGINRGTLLKFKLNEVLNEKENASDEPKSSGYFKLDNLPIKRAVFIDSTWNQSRSIFKDPRINQLRPVVLQNRLSQFWRHQKGSPRWFLATIEGIIEFRIPFLVDFNCFVVIIFYSNSSIFVRGSHQCMGFGSFVPWFERIGNRNEFYSR